MQVLWAPWRMAYIGGPKSNGCIFCEAAETREHRERLVLVQHPALVMLNKFPYTSGHLMVAPRRHVADFGTLSPEELQALMQTLQRALTVLSQAFQPQGMNVGMNLGAAAGAGIVDHLHWHLVPRWVGDTNFMPMLAEVRVIPEHLETTYDRLLPLLEPLDT